MKVIFLDFDGVLNSTKDDRVNNKTHVIINADKLAMLEKIVSKTDARIVLSTSWKTHWSNIESQCDNIGLFINQTFRKYNLDIYDKTPVLKTGRENEIKTWLINNPKVDNYVILDDMILYDKAFENRYIKISDYFGGLNKSDVEKAIEILNKQ